MLVVARDIMQLNLYEVTLPQKDEIKTPSFVNYKWFGL